MCTDARKGRGATEEIVGRWFAQGGGRREKTVLATKLYGDMGDWPNEGRLSALNIRRACDASLRRLQTDYIDLYQMHHIDRTTGWDEIWEAMEVLRAQGKILYVGSSNFAGWHIAKAQAAAAERHFMGLVSEQSIYNLLARKVEMEVLPAALDYGVGVIPWSPLHGGLLGGVVRKSARAAVAIRAGRPTPSRPADPNSSSTRICARSWARSRPRSPWPGCCPVRPSPRPSSDRARPSSSMGRCGRWRSPLDDKVLARLDDIFPGYKTSPEEYAW
jgi:aryl-alcohol dehydrogenase-like predicted oxidoreductase